MKMRQSKVGLLIPVEDPESKNKLSSTEEVIKWRSNLPMADTGNTAKQVYVTLRELNTYKLDPKIRFEMLELFRPPLQLVCQALRKHYVNQSTELTKKKITIANLAQKLQLEISNGYKIIIDELNSSKKSELIKEILPDCIYRVIHYYTLVLLRCYQLYSDSPSKLWQELHIIYSIANEQKIINNKITHESLPGSTYTIETCYKHVLMLAATNPFQWRQNEQDIIHRSLDKWAEFAILRKASKSDEDKPGTYIFDIKQDLPPSPIKLNKINLSSSCFVIDLQGVIKHIQGILDEVKADEVKAKIKHDLNPEYSISEPTLTRIVKDWSTVIKRRMARFSIIGKMDLTIGLSATHYFASGGAEFNPESKRLATVKHQHELDKEGHNDLPTFEIQENELDGEFNETSQFEIKLENEQPEPKKPQNKEEFIKHSCSLFDITPHGCCLIWEQDVYPPIQAGEIVSIKNSIEPKDNPWNIGVIRWLKHDSFGKLKIGIQILAPHATAAGAQILKDGMPTGYFLRCLILPKMESLSLESTIITPTLPFKEGKSVCIATEQIEYLVNADLIKQVDATGNYRQFEYKSESSLVFPIQKKEPEDHKDQLEPNLQDKENLDDDFGSVWDEL